MFASLCFFLGLLIISDFFAEQDICTKHFRIYTITVKFSFIVVKYQLLHHSCYLDIDEKCTNGHSYIYICRTFENLKALSSFVKSLFPVSTNGNLEMKRLWNKIPPSPPGTHLFIASRRSRILATFGTQMKTEVLRHTFRTLLLVFLVYCLAKQSFLQIYHRMKNKRI